MKKTILFFTLIALVAFSSCSKEGGEKEDFDKEKWEKEGGEWEKDECFELVYPVTFIMPDETSITVNDDKDFAVEEWYKTNESEEKPQLQYPVDIIYEDDGMTETVTISNDEEMGNAKKECYDDEWEKEECFTLVYPITFTMPDGSAITVNDEEDSAVKDWYNANPDVEAKPELQYPVDILYKDDEVTETVTISNEEEMMDAKKECYDDKWEKEGCFEIVFPISFTMPDGSTISGNDKDELWSAMKNWYEANPDSEEKPQLQYPVDILFEDDTTQTVNNEDQMATAKEECED